MRRHWVLFLAAGLATLLLLGCGMVLLFTEEPEPPLPRLLWDAGKAGG